ncbi:MAG: hypothetical protein ACLQM8_14075 [Limisphaerales bacterium]
MNVLDENILESQRQLLRGWRVPVRQIGHELAHKGLQDQELVPFLLTLRRPTLFTRDLGFYDRALCHSRYCVVVLAVGQYEVAHFVRRLLRHRDFATQPSRMGAILRLMHTGLAVWRLHAERELRLPWPG